MSRITVTYRIPSDDGSSDEIDVVMRPEQYAAYQRGQWAPAFWINHPTEVYGPSHGGRMASMYDVSDEPLPWEGEGGVNAA